MSEIIKNRYVLSKLIGKGGMAEVYLAYDSILNREVAIKILKADMSDDDVALQRFDREAGATTQLSHPNIVDVYDVGEDNGKHFIVMEYVKGYTLKQLIKRRGPIPYKEAVWLMKQLAGGLMEAHRKGIIHRDVKSQNVLIKPDGTVKLSDFGIALSADAMQITSKDSVLGSVHYLAPEISKGKQASMQSDIYSLGIVFYELLTGDVPFKGDTPIQVALKHVKQQIPYVRTFNRDIPQAVENIIILATAKDLNNRYKNIAIMLKDLNECLKLEHQNDSRIVFGSSISNTRNKHISIAADIDHSKQNKSKFHKLFIGLACIFAIISLGFILVLSGAIKPKKTSEIVPDLTNMTVLEAKDFLNEYELEIDDSRIVYELTDNIDKDLIISTNPSRDTEVELGTKIKVVVSSGKYSILDNYIGKDYLKSKAQLQDLNFTVRLVPMSDSENAGKIIEQSLPEGYKYDGSINNQIELKYGVDGEIVFEFSLGSKITEVKEYLEENNIEYETIKEDIEDLDEEILNTYKPLTLIKCEPDISSAIKLSDDLVVKIYYYEEEESE